MILLVCPICKVSSSKARTKLTILATGLTCVVPSREGGVEYAVAPPIRLAGRHANIAVLPDSNLICDKCGEESPGKLWKYMVLCDDCGREITSKAVKDPSEVSDRYICRDTMSFYCDKCWKRSSNKEYCPSCRYRETCSTYNNR